MSDHLERIKVGAFERRMMLAKASMIAGTRFAAQRANNLFKTKAAASAANKEALREQAQYFVSELGKLKGSVVKVGQMLALYGEHFLPSEVTEALHTLNDRSTPLSWRSISPIIAHQLGAQFALLQIDPEPIGCASLAQVHRAVIKATGEVVVLKVRYPGVKEAIHSDLALVKQVLSMSKLLPQTAEFEVWYQEIEAMMQREVDYAAEVETTILFKQLLADDHRFVIPTIYPEFCREGLICMSFELGMPIHAPELLQLSSARRNRIALAAVELAFKEIFQFNLMQTDPNFGNYLIRIDEQQQTDQIVLLDFGAVRAFDSTIISVARGLMRAGFCGNEQQMLTAMDDFFFFERLPPHSKSDFARLFLLASEALATAPMDCPWVHHDLYHWAECQLHERVVKQAAASAASKYFSVPPKEFIFLARKFIGVYTLLTHLHAQTQLHKDLAVIIEAAI